MFVPDEPLDLRLHNQIDRRQIHSWVRPVLQFWPMHIGVSLCNALLRVIVVVDVTLLIHSRTTPSGGRWISTSCCRLSLYIWLVDAHGRRSIPTLTLLYLEGRRLPRSQLKDNTCDRTSADVNKLLSFEVTLDETSSSSGVRHLRDIGVWRLETKSMRHLIWLFESMLRTKCDSSTRGIGRRHVKIVLIKNMFPSTSILVSFCKLQKKVFSTRLKRWLPVGSNLETIFAWTRLGAWNMARPP